jgi:hypothetical protein
MGARVVPIVYNANPDKIAEIMQKLNGIMITGGKADIIKTKDHETIHERRN